MSFFQELGANQVLVSASLGWLIAQILKTLIDLWYNRSFQAERLWGRGGRPKLLNPLQFFRRRGVLNCWDLPQPLRRRGGLIG